MKKIITLLSLVSITCFGMSQVVFQSDLSSWDTAGDPTDWMGARSSISSANVTQQTIGATYGSSMASLLNSSSSHKRFTTQPVTVVGGTKYIIQMWVAGTSGELRVNFHGGSYGTYTAYQNIGTLSAGSLVMVTDSFTVPSGVTSGEFILSVRNTSSTAGIGMILDSVSIFRPMGPPPPPPSFSAKTIYQIQNTTLPSGDSPLKDSLVETSGIVTGTHSSGYFLQDGVGAWNGVYVYDPGHTAMRGDELKIRGKVKEYNDLTEVADIDTAIVVSTGNTLPSVTAATTTTGADEKYEGVLLKVSAAMCVDSNAGFGEWEIQNPSMDTLRVDDLLFAYVPVQYQGYDVTGVMHYSFGAFKLEPRDSTDIVQSLLVSVDDKENELTVEIFPNPVQNIFTLKGINLERAEIYATNGKLIRTISLNTINTIDVYDLAKGSYILKVYSDNKFGISRFVKL